MHKLIIIIIIIGAWGTIKNILVDQNLQLHPGHQSAIELQKVTLISIAQSIRKVLR